MLYVDNTLLRSVARCDSEAFIRHVLGFTTQRTSPKLLCGSAVHLAVAHYLSTWDAAAALGVFQAAWESMSYELRVEEDDPRWSYRWTAPVLERWFEKRRRSMLPFVKIEAIEEPLMAPLCSGITFVSRPDAVVLTDDGKWMAYETKTTGRASQTRYRLDSQVSGQAYAMAAQGRPVAGVYINVIEWPYAYKDMGTKCREHGTPRRECHAEHAVFETLVEYRSPGALSTWRANAEMLALRYRDVLQRYAVAEMMPAVLQQGTFHGACDYCSYQDFCSAGRPLTNLDTLFVHDPWDPVVGAHDKPAA